MRFLPNDFWEFYKSYLGEHRNHLNRILHHIGTLLAILCSIVGIFSGQIYFIPIGITLGYGFAWTGHFFIEKNRPTTFKRPLYSFIADFVMLYDLFTFTLDKKIRDL